MKMKYGGQPNGKEWHGLSEEDVAQGYETLDDTCDAQIFGRSKRSPERQNWHDMPQPGAMMLPFDY